MLGPVLTYQSLSSLDQEAPVYLVILLVFMIVDITRSVVAVLHSSSVRSYKYPDHLPVALTDPLSLLPVS